MQDQELLLSLLSAESEDELIGVMESRGLLTNQKRWRFLGDMVNNQSIVQAQQSSATAALVEKFTNGLDAILLKHCKAEGIDPRGPAAPQSMSDAITRYFGETADADVRKAAEENLVLYATGSKARPCLSLYDAGEGQFPDDFPKTFCSLIYGSAAGSYKGAIPFVQGRFNMGGTGVLPFCSDKYKLQLIVSRVAPEVAKADAHEWGFTLFCYFASKQAPSWKYLVGEDGRILTAGSSALKLVPKLSAKSGEICLPRERAVRSGTLIKMYDYKAPRSNVCGELFKKLADYLLRPSLPLRIIECRPEYKANVMGVNVWSRFDRWVSQGKLEEGFEEGASISIKLSTGEIIPAEVRVFKLDEKTEDEQDQAQTGLRALINGQSHASRDAQFFRTKAVNKEHIAGSMLVTLDCSELGQDSRNNLFMSNRETFREDPLLKELFDKLQKELAAHEGLAQLDLKRYEEKIKNAIDDEEGISALEELLSTDPDLADLFGTRTAGKVAAKTATGGFSGKIPGKPVPFAGLEFPTFIYRTDKSTVANLHVPAGEVARALFRTDVKNNYFSRHKHRGQVAMSGDFEPTFHLFNGRLTFRYPLDKKTPPGTQLASEVLITDNVGSGPFNLTISITVLPASEPAEPAEPKPPKPPRTPKVEAGPSRPDIKEMERGPDEKPLIIEKVPDTERLQLILNTTSRQLEEAKRLRAKSEAPAIEFVFKYGLALTAMGLLDAAKKSDEWQSNESVCRDRIEESTQGIARVIVPLCLSLPKKIPKLKG